MYSWLPLHSCQVIVKKCSDILDSLQFCFDELHLKNETFNFYIRGHKK